jgi:hypothetical protein
MEKGFVQAAEEERESKSTAQLVPSRIQWRRFLAELRTHTQWTESVL